MGGRPGLSELEKLVLSPDEKTRLKAVIDLAACDDERAVTLLQRVIAMDESTRVRFLAKRELFSCLWRGQSPDESASGGETKIEAQAGAVSDSFSGGLEAVAEILEQGRTRDKVELLRIITKRNYVEALPLIVKAASTEKDGLVRSHLVMVMGMLGDVSLIGPVVKFLYDGDARVRANAIEALEYIDHPDVYPFIVKFLGDPDNRIRANAIKALDKEGRVDVVTLLRQMLSSDEIWMRESAAYTLSVLGSHKALPLLSECLRSENANVRRRARQGLENLASRGNDAAKKAVADLALMEENVRSACDCTDIEAILAEGVDDEDGLKSPDPQVRIVALREIQKERDVGRVADIAEMIRSELDPFVRASAVSVLGELESPAAADILLECLRSSVSRVRANAIEALVKIGYEDIVTALSPLLEDDSSRCRANAVIALKSCSAVDVLGPLEKLIESSLPYERKSGFFAVTHFSDETVLPFLEKLCDDEDDEISISAKNYMMVLSRRGLEGAVQWLQARELKLQEEKELNGDFSSELTDSLLPTVDGKLEEDSTSEDRSTASDLASSKGRLAYDDPEVRLLEVRRLVAEREIQGVEIIMAALKTERNRRVVIEMLSALGSLGSFDITDKGDLKQRMSGLIAGFTEDDRASVRVAALKALSLIGGRSTIEAIKNRLDDEAEEVRIAAASLLETAAHRTGGTLLIALKTVAACLAVFVLYLLISRLAFHTVDPRSGLTGRELAAFIDCLVEKADDKEIDAAIGRLARDTRLDRGIMRRLAYTRRLRRGDVKVIDELVKAPTGDPFLLGQAFHLALETSRVRQARDLLLADPKNRETPRLAMELILDYEREASLRNAYDFIADLERRGCKSSLLAGRKFLLGVLLKNHDISGQ